MPSADVSVSLPYHEPSILTILVQSSLLLLLNTINSLLDRALYCGLVGQVLVGVAWGTPGAQWLGSEVEGVVVQLGYLGLLLLVYEGGLSTNLTSLRANALLSTAVALTGISLPIALSFILSYLIGATPLQCFAAGAALCSTSLGTTFTVLGTSGLSKSRLGVVLTSAAMMDDVVGLVMVQVISELGQGVGAGDVAAAPAVVNAVTIVRPLFVSLAFAAVAPIVCSFLVKPLTLWILAKRGKFPGGLPPPLSHTTTTTWLMTQEAAWILHTLILVGLITAATYAGTSNLFAAYIAGVSISWWDVSVSHCIQDNSASSETPRMEPASAANTSRGGDITEQANLGNTPSTTYASSSGVEVYKRYYATPVNRVLKPFFFASIGFSVPITEMFSGDIVWKGLVYTVLMIIGKLVCGAWLLRLPSIEHPTPIGVRNNLNRLTLPFMFHFWGSKSDKPARKISAQPQEPVTLPLDEGTSQQTASNQPVQTVQEFESLDVDSQGHTPAMGTTSHTTPADAKPRSLYPASILGCAMTARGEIGFLISSIAESNGVFSASSSSSSSSSLSTSSTQTKRSSSDIFLVVTWAIVLCTILGPLAVGLIVQRVHRLQRGLEKHGQVVRQDVLGVWGVS